MGPISRPLHIDPLAERILGLLAGQPQAGEIVLGGYFALRHYLDYRMTHDIDAWWKTRLNPATEDIIRQAMIHTAAAERLESRERRFGETISFELVREGRRTFSFQIAVRSIAIEPPLPSSWPPILIETLADNVGSKMNALVDRGSPRDFTDIRRVVEADLVSAAQCWKLWSIKNPGLYAAQAKQKVLFHLAALEGRRPLDDIQDSQERAKAQAVRRWFSEEFTKP
jgi:Nucleotidyl transferase AbiEii toxin, Type IV TA system